MAPSLKRRSLVFLGEGRSEIREQALQTPSAGQVLVETRLSAISSGTELLVYRGLLPQELELDESIPALRGKPAYPMEYGYSVVGEVTELGPEASSEWRGARVFAFHPHSTRFWTDPQALLTPPPDLSDEQALFLPNVETAVNLVHDGAPRLGEQAVIFGQGVVGLLTTALLAEHPLAKLLTLDRFSLRREASIELGAHASLDPEDAKAWQGLVSELAASHPNDGADLSYELSGSPGALDQAISITGFNGRVVVGSWYGRKKTEVDLGGRFHRNRIQLISSQVSTIHPALSGRWDKSRRQVEAWRWISRVDPDRLITHRIPFEQAPQAFELLSDTPQSAIQVILTYGEHD